MSMSELKAAIVEYREQLKANSRKVVASSENGPVSMSMIDKVVSELEAQEKRIAKLEQKMDGITRFS